MPSEAIPSQEIGSAEVIPVTFLDDVLKSRFTNNPKPFEGLNGITQFVLLVMLQIKRQSAVQFPAEKEKVNSHYFVVHGCCS